MVKCIYCKKQMKHEVTALIEDNVMNVYTCDCGSKCIFLTPRI